jgi:predicted lipid-binding transport protein (Tim44 family)
MPYTTDATAILAIAREQLQDLLTRAVEDQAYEDVASIARLADHVSRLLNGNGNSASHHTEGVATTMANSSGYDDAPSTAGATRRQRSRHKTLPRFERDGDRLVKVAWSKRDHAEYEHRAARDVVFLLLEAIRRNKGEGAVFESQDVLPLIDGGREIPSYQAYVVLAWLREEGIVKKKGRNGYILKANAAPPERIDELWKTLPSTHR